MKNAKFLVAIVLPIVAGLLMTTQDANAKCKAEKVKVHINEHGIWLKPDGGPKCLFVPGLSDVNVTFPIVLKTPGKYKLRDGQVHIRQVLAKEENGASIGCSSDLEFEESVYTNTGEDDIVVTVIGEDVPENAFICYEIVVDDIGMLDPRAQVEDQVGMSAHLAGELFRLTEAFELLNESSLGDSLAGVSLEDFIESGYDMTEAEAHQLIKEYRD